MTISVFSISHNSLESRETFQFEYDEIYKGLFMAMGIISWRVALQSHNILFRRFSLDVFTQMSI